MHVTEQACFVFYLTNRDPGFYSFPWRYGYRKRNEYALILSLNLVFEWLAKFDQFIDICMRSLCPH